jgi:3-phenylpropionate/trans-cinnamate dioxygenase ferredoxin reductase component
MSQRDFAYIIVGGGLAGASAIEGIRERDAEGAILLIGAEPHPPYHRPPLTKQLWTGKKKIEDIFVHDEAFYRDRRVTLLIGSKATRVDAGRRLVTTDRGDVYHYAKLLIATGGEPRRLTIPGGDLPEICYFRTLADYVRIRDQAAEARSVLVIGGGFIGSEIAAALKMNNYDVTMVFPDPILGVRLFPESLGRALQEQYQAHGVEVLSGDLPVSISRSGKKLITQTRADRRIESDLIVAGIGMLPETQLARTAGLQTSDGIIVTAHLQTSDPNIYAAGDNTLFPQAVVGRSRVEHWDNALNQGRWAGRNMAGANDEYTYMPYFFSDLFDFGYEAVGQVDSGLETFADWQQENQKGVIYYLAQGRVTGVMMCNVWDKVESARALILGRRSMAMRGLQGAIR